MRGGQIQGYTNHGLMFACDRVVLIRGSRRRRCKRQFLEHFENRMARTQFR